MHKNTKLYLLAIIIIYTIYLPVTQRVDISIGIVVLGSIGILEMVNLIKPLHNKNIFRYILFALVMTFPISYSNDFTQGLLYLVKNILSILFIAVGIKLSQKRNIDCVLSSIMIVSVPLMIVNVFFAFNNTVEMNFVNTRFAKILIAPTSLVNVYGSNITDINKAGTIFPNTNNASVFFSLLYAIGLIQWGKTKKCSYIVLSLICGAAVLSTGCRTGILVLLFDIMMLFYIKNHNIANKVIYSILISLGIMIILIFVDIPFISNTISRLSWSVIKHDPRNVLWEFALKNIRLFGYGYGGWEKLVQSLPGYFQGFPPHNHILVLLFIGGIIPALLYILFWGGLIYQGYKAYRIMRIDSGLLLVLVVSNVLIHGFFDNYFLTQTNIMQLTFIVVGVCLSEISKLKVK